MDVLRRTMTHVCVRSRGAQRHRALQGPAENAPRSGNKMLAEELDLGSSAPAPVCAPALVRHTRPCNAQRHLCHVWAKRHLCAQCHLGAGWHQCPKRTNLFRLSLGQGLQECPMPTTRLSSMARGNICGGTSPPMRFTSSMRRTSSKGIW